MRVNRVFGPVPSRRLGRSLGVNNIPPKHCSYSCIYCQVGKTKFLEVARRAFYDWRELVEEVARAVERVGRENIDYVTFVPDGEPTLDINLGKEIEAIKRLADLPVAVLTNGSLLHLSEVREDLGSADLVSIKIDAADEHVFRRINRPHPSLSLSKVLEGVATFSGEFNGKTITETMFVRGVNDDPSHAGRIADIVSSLNPHRAYIAVPTRPPALSWVKPTSEENMLRIYREFEERLSGRVEMLTGYEGSDFTIDPEAPERGILAITSVHPMRLDYAERVLLRLGLDPRRVIGGLASEGRIVIVEYGGHRFIMRRFT